MLTTQRFAKFIYETEYDGIPEEVINIVKERILDTIGAAIAGYSNWEYKDDFIIACKNLGTGDHNIIGNSKVQFPISRVAMINSTYAHSIELDDGHKNAGCHAGAVVIPTALAIGSMTKCSGKELINAIVIGYDVIYRLASNLNPAQITKGFHPSSNCDVFGAVAVAGKLMGLCEEQLAYSLGHAGMFASGTMETTISGQHSKCIQVGNAAYNGIMSAYFAKGNMHGCMTIFEGKNGIFKIQGENVKDDNFFNNIGSSYLITDTYSKMYPTCRHSQPGIEAALDLAKEYELNPKDISSIRVGTHKVAYDLTGIIKSPKNSTEAKFSLAYGIAVALKERSFGVTHLVESFYLDPVIQKLSHLVECYIDPEIHEKYPQKRGARVQIVLKDGCVISRDIFDLKGSPNKPIGWKELEEKFDANTFNIVPKENQIQLKKLISNIESVADSSQLSELMSW